MKKVFLLIFCCVCYVCLYAQAESKENKQKIWIIESMPNATIHQDSAITKRLTEMVYGIEQEIIEMDGYRVQIYSSNLQQVAKTEATRLERDLTDKVDVAVYVSYTPPFWKVRLGDFKTREEAIAFKNAFMEEHPELMGDTYIVRDKIQVKK